MEAQVEAFLDVFSYEELVGLVAYPNPFTDEIHLLFSSEIGQSEEVMIFDMLGHCLYHDNLRLYGGMQHFVIRPDLASGVYMLKIGDHVQRIVRY